MNQNLITPYTVFVTHIIIQNFHVLPKPNKDLTKLRSYETELI